MALPLIRPQPLVRIPEPFNGPEWLYEIKLDGFRSLAYIELGQCRWCPSPWSPWPDFVSWAQFRAQ